MRLLLFVLTFVVYNNPSQECDNYFDDKSQLTIYANSDLNSVINKFNLTLPFKKIGNKCNINEFNITFYESEIDAKLENNRLLKPHIYQTAFSKKLFVRLDNKDSGFIQIIELKLKIR